MKMKTIQLAVLATLMSSSVTVFAAATKTIDFYSTNGNNRYSISGEIKDLNLDIDNKTVLIKEADADAYVTLNNKLPYHVRFLESDMNVYQVLEGNKGKKVIYKNKEVKILGFQGTNIIAESDEGVIFVPVENIVLPKGTLKNTTKGLQATFDNSIAKSDKVFYSQEERGLRYNNIYHARMMGNKINVAHYFNIMNSTKKTFEDVNLNFFLSQTNISNDRMPRPMEAMSMKASIESSVSMAPPEFEQENIQNLKTISLKNPVTIYPSLNKIKYIERTYDMEQYSIVNLNKNHIIYLGNIIREDPKTINVEGSKLNKLFKEHLNNYKEELLRGELNVDNIISIKVNDGDILPSGKMDIYENVKGNDKLIVSTQIDYTENEKLEVLKNNNSNLKLRDVVFKSLDGKEIFPVVKNFNVEVLIKSVVIENLGDNVETIKIFGKKYVIKPKSKITINA